MTNADLETELYRTIAFWCAGGIGVMLLIVGLALYDLGAPLWTHDAIFVYQLGIGLGAFGGISVGFHQARAVSRAREASLSTEQRNRLEEFASIVSHDLRNPLRVAEGGLELAREECQSEQLDQVDQALDRMDALIEDLLTLAREGETVKHPEPVELSAIARDCWATVETSNAELVIDIDRTISADRSRLRQVIENLVRNAVEHGGDAVTVIIGELDNGFFVEDNGPGIPDVERKKIFEAGYSTNDDGTGFGVSIIKQVIEAHGWEIQVNEGTSGGARFEVRDIEFLDK